MSRMICEQCQGGHGTIPVLRKNVEQVFKSGASQPEVIKYTCPFCGWKEGSINTHGELMSAAEKTTILNTLLAGVPSSRVIVG